MKLRLPTWWWGRYIFKKSGAWYTQDGDFYAYQIDTSSFIKYEEELHGLPAALPHITTIEKEWIENEYKNRIS